MSCTVAGRRRFLQLTVVRSQDDLSTRSQMVLDEGRLNGDRVQDVADGDVRTGGEEEDHRGDSIVLDDQLRDDSVGGDQKSCE